MAAPASPATRAGGRCRRCASQDGPRCSAAVASISSPAAGPRRSCGADAAHLRCCGLRSSLAHITMRALRCSPAPRIWAASAPDLSPRSAAVLLRALLPRLVAIAVLAVGFQVLTIAVSLGSMDMADHDVEQAMASAWDPPLHPLFQGIALLGGVVVTTIVLVALGLVIWRRGLVAAALVFVAVLLAQLFDLVFESSRAAARPPWSAQPSGSTGHKAQRIRRWGLRKTPS